MKELIVWWGLSPVGRLWASPSGELLFRYRPEARLRISASLPLDPGRDQPGTFFSNLLPDGELRQVLARRLGVSADNDFAMLEAVGGDCAGALSLFPPDATPPRTSSRRPLTPAALRRVHELGTPAFSATDGLRMSLAGAQDKLPVILDGTRLFLPEGASCSTHILKLPSPRYRRLPENEWLMTHLARAIGLPTVETRLWPLPDAAGNALLVTRFDRKDGQRLHQEDLCQALGVPPWRKYEADGGPTLADAIRLLATESTEPATDIDRLVRWQVFNALAGNADGHAKNLALIREGERIRLAPFYDLVCTRQWGALSKELALSVGGVADPGQLGMPQWRDAARAWEVSPSYLLEVARHVASSLRLALGRLPSLAAAAGVAPTAARTVGGTVGKLVKRAEALLKVK